MDIFLGEPPASIKTWFIKHYYVPAETRVWWSDDPNDYDDYLIEGEFSYFTKSQIPNLTAAYKIEFGSEIDYIGGGAIEPSSPNLTSISIPGSVEAIDQNAIYCGNITDITLGNGITEIPYQAFVFCQNLSSINIPDSVMIIQRDAFYIYDESKLFDLTTIPGMYLLDNWIIWNVDQGYHLTSLNLSNIRGIADEAFMNTILVSSTLTIPSTVKSIGELAFEFNHCELTSITIEDGIKYIGCDAFIGCYLVTDVYCYANPNQLHWEDASDGNFKQDGSTICHVRASDLATYQSKFGGKVNVQFVGDLT